MLVKSQLGNIDLFRIPQFYSDQFTYVIPSVTCHCPKAHCSHCPQVCLAVRQDGLAFLCTASFWNRKIAVFLLIYTNSRLCRNFERRTWWVFDELCIRSTDECGITIFAIFGLSTRKHGLPFHLFFPLSFSGEYFILFSVKFQGILLYVLLWTLYFVTTLYVEIWIIFLFIHSV